MASQRNRSCWKQRVRFEHHAIILLMIGKSTIIKNAIILLMIAFLIIVDLPIAVTLSSGPNKNETQPICLDQGCVEAAAQVLKNMDKSSDPCDDFYQFACGNFMKETGIPPDQAAITPFHLLHDTVQKQLKEMFEEPSRTNEIKPFTLVKKLYNICMNTTAIDADGTRTIKQYFRKAGGWPILEGGSWNERDFDWRNITKTFRNLGLRSSSFIEVRVGTNLLNSTKRMLMIDQGGKATIPITFAEGLDDPIVKDYYQYLIDFAIYFGADCKNVENDVKGVILFLYEIAKINLSEEERQDILALYNPMTIAELQKANPSVDWLDYINSIIIGREDKHVTSSEIINLVNLQYISNFLNLINRTSKRDQANYAFFQAALLLPDYLPDEIQIRQQQYLALFTGTTIRPPRWRECVYHISKLDLAVGAMYVRRYFQDETTRSALELMSDIKNVFVQIVKDLEWMDDTTKKTAIEKALAMTPCVGYPIEFLDDNRLKKIYKRLNFNSGSFIKAMSALDIFKRNIELRKMKTPVNKTDWRSTIPSYSINAQYDPQTNNIWISAAILQGIFYNKNSPQYMNYGALGYVIGHEFTHGFDNQGKLFDIHGNLENWWANNTAKAYTERAKCIVDQYSNITIPEIGVNINGALTQNENIADNGGIKEAYLAYNRYVERNGTEPALPGLNFTPNQMFWISAANVWCVKARPESLLNDIHSDPHSPRQYRASVPFSNTEYFAKDFNCPTGSKMNPKHKCRVW